MPEVKRIERTLGKKLEQRTLEDFNYKAAGSSQKKLGDVFKLKTASQIKRKKNK